MGQTTPILNCAVFDPEAVHLMGEAFDAVKALLKTSPPSAAAEQCIASRIMEAVCAGERDVTRLRDAGLDGANVVTH